MPKKPKRKLRKGKKSKRKKRRTAMYRSSITGEAVSAEFAKSHPTTTVRETR